VKELIDILCTPLPSVCNEVFCCMQVSKAMDLKGHRASVLDISFSGDSHRCGSFPLMPVWTFL